jgi:bifunctional UDP-N-acetylglucosamine pyrophosphorylase/glucosamine-1-phosphate N-acetyltransferase
MAQGVKLYDPTRIDVRGELTVGHDVEIDINCIFEGEVSLGDNVRIGANCVIRNTRIDAGSEIKPMTSIEDAIIGRKVSIGPFARIRPGTECADEVRIGNFVETKQARIGQGSKVNHLSYIGDTEMGSGVNIGAGTITCNYDGYAVSGPRAGGAQCDYRGWLDYHQRCSSRQAYPVARETGYH